MTKKNCKVCGRDIATADKETELYHRFEDIIRHELSDDEFWGWVRSWLDVEGIIDRALDWDIEIIKDQLADWKKEGKIK